jgi:hypothetical protein
MDFFKFRLIRERRQKNRTAARLARREERKKLASQKRHEEQLVIQDDGDMNAESVDTFDIAASIVDDEREFQRLQWTRMDSLHK